MMSCHPQTSISVRCAVRQNLTSASRIGSFNGILFITARLTHFGGGGEALTLTERGVNPIEVLSPSNVNQCQMRSAPEFD